MNEGVKCVRCNLLAVAAAAAAVLLQFVFLRQTTVVRLLAHFSNLFFLSSSLSSHLTE